MVVLLPVKVTLLSAKTASLNWRQTSNFSLMLAAQRCCVWKPGAGFHVSAVGLCVLIHIVHVNTNTRPYFFIRTLLLQYFPAVFLDEYTQFSSLNERHESRRCSLPFFTFPSQAFLQSRELHDSFWFLLTHSSAEGYECQVNRCQGGSSNGESIRSHRC